MILKVLFLCLLLEIYRSSSVNGQLSQNVPFPSKGDSCNVVQVNCGSAPSTEKESQHRYSRTPGPPGKQGSDGIKGDIGSKGERGEVGDKGQKGEGFDRAEMLSFADRIEDRLNEKINIMEMKMNEMNEKIENMNMTILNNLPSSILKSKGMCPVQLGEKCFYVKIQEVTMDQARELCAENKALPANIYNEKHLVDVMNEIRPKIPGSSIYLWTGMNVHLTTGAVSMRDGTPAPYVKWWTSGLPQRNEASLYVHVQNHQSSTAQGMGNDPPTSIRNGVICEI